MDREIAQVDQADVRLIDAALANDDARRVFAETVLGSLIQSIPNDWSPSMTTTPSFDATSSMLAS
jgi:hypothetical protein